MIETTITRSPFLSVLTSRPVSTTSPRNSWPMTSPAFMVGTKPSSRCRSEPQTEDSPTRTMASCGLTISGSGTRSVRRSLTPFQQIARIRTRVVATKERDRD